MGGALPHIITDTHSHIVSLSVADAAVSFAAGRAGLEECSCLGEKEQDCSSPLCVTLLEGVRVRVWVTQLELWPSSQRQELCDGSQ